MKLNKKQMSFLAGMLGVDLNKPISKEFYRNRHVAYNRLLDEDIEKLLYNKIIKYDLQNEVYLYYVTSYGKNIFKMNTFKREKKYYKMSEAPKDKDILIFNETGWHVCAYDEQVNKFMVTCTYDNKYPTYVKNPIGWNILP